MYVYMLIYSLSISYFLSLSLSLSLCAQISLCHVRTCSVPMVLMCLNHQFVLIGNGVHEVAIMLRLATRRAATLESIHM